VCDERRIKKKEERKRKKISTVLYSSFTNTGMFHSEEEHDRTVDLIDELQHSYGSTTTATNPASTFEFDQIIPCDIDSIGFDFDRDFRRTDSWGTNSSTCFTLGEPQCFTTFTSEDKWPI
jgi:hypothetical protein